MLAAPVERSTMTRHDHDDFGGLERDLARLLPRRHALGLLAGAGAVLLVGCGPDSDDGRSAGTTSTTGGASTSGGTTATTTGESCSSIPSETGGPYPGDGTNGPNVLTENGVVRSDITTSFGSASGVAEGVPLTIELVVLDAAGCAPSSGAAIYAWHCDAEGRYSLYSQGVSGENFLRGVQAAGADGRLTFRTIFPGAYSGRWPHVHFEVYPSLAHATSAANRITTSQLALPADACELVYATAGYEQSARNFPQTSIERDNVFGDGYELQLATVTGPVDDGLTATLSVAV
jgi:protocatechuate 3,4-dioxygenase beta subunit